jgi:hypothetical protein
LVTSMLLEQGEVDLSEAVDEVVEINFFFL